MTDMMSRFEQSNFEPVVVAGQLVHSYVPMKVGSGDIVRITWMSAASPRTQGLSLRLRRRGIKGARGYAGRLRSDELVGPGIALWTDLSSPAPVVECEEIPDDVQLEVSNRWRHETGRVDEWLNNYGIVIEELEPDSWILHCSDGVGDQPTFDDLVVRIDITRATRTAT